MSPFLRTGLVPAPPMEHAHPPLPTGARPCEYGAIAVCARCGVTVAPCTHTTYRQPSAVANQTYVCLSCRPVDRQRRCNETFEIELIVIEEATS